ncbi:SDR family oxidoreductase [Rugosimonospora acidiphila]|uniref:SDR family oxidoreductase n=1 Tax=Rugosimonospora acidiphila TaxID=556531 RepID=A0ABP9RNG9_9ACTN
MKIAVFGATGGTGAHIVRQGLDAGHDVIAVVRDPARLGLPPSGRLTVLAAPVTDAEAILPAVEPADAIVSGLGPRPGDQAGICSTGTATIIQAMEKAGRARLVVISASGPYVDEGDGLLARYVAKPLLGRLLRDGFDDLRRMEQLVRASGLQWTIMRPPRLTNRASTGRYRTAVDRNTRGIRVSRADLATATLRVLDDPATAGHSIGVAN